MQFKEENVNCLDGRARNRKVNRDRWELDRVRYQMSQPAAPQRHGCGERYCCGGGSGLRSAIARVDSGSSFGMAQIGGEHPLLYRASRGLLKRALFIFL